MERRSFEGSKVAELCKLASDECQEQEFGVWTKDEEQIERALRKVTYYGDIEYSTVKILDAANKLQTPMAGILEYVFSSSYVCIYIYRLQTVIKMQLAHLYSPNSKDDAELHEEGK